MIALFSTGFRKRYLRLQKNLREKFDTQAKLFATDPFNLILDNYPLHGGYAGCRSINVTGDYKAIFYHESETVVRFIAIGTHHELFGN